MATAKTPSKKRATAKKSASKSTSRKKVKKEDLRERALVTGASGGLGRLLCRKLHRTHQVIGVDRRPFPDRPKDVEHHRLDLRRKSAIQLLKKKKPDCIIHLGIIHNPQREQAFHFNLEGTAQLLKLAEKLKIKKFVFLSTANLYGPSATTSGFLSEEAPLLGAPSSPEVRDLISLDMMVQSFFWKRPETETVVLRPVHIVGPHLRNAPSKYFRLKTIPSILGFDPMIQLIHELDVVDALIHALKPGVRGVFNVVGPGQAPLSRMIDVRGSSELPIPGPIFSASLDRLFRMHLTNFPATELDHLRYSCLVDGSRAEHDMKFRAKRTLRETLIDL